MGLFVHEDPYYDPDVRQVGFNRYKQLLSRHAFSWIKLNLLTVAGALPLAAGIGYAILSSSILVLIPLSIVGGMIWGPFLAGLYDGILRGLRDAPESWWTAWRKSLRQNGRESLLPGAVLGLLIGMYAFHHKTKHPKFVIGIPLLLGLHGSVWIMLFFFQILPWRI